MLSGNGRECTDRERVYASAKCGIAAAVRTYDTFDLAICFLLQNLGFESNASEMEQPDRKGMNRTTFVTRETRNCEINID